MTWVKNVRRCQVRTVVRYPSPMRGSRIRAILTYVAAVLVAYMLGHQLSFLASFGSDMGHGLESTGHGGLWNLSVAIVAVLAISLSTLAARRILVLSRETGRWGGAYARYRASREPVEPLASAIIRLWLLVLAPALILFVVSENVEHVASGLAAPGIGVFDGAVYGWAPLAFLFASFVTAAVLALYRWRHAVLVARIAAATEARPQRSSQRHRLASADWRLPRSGVAGSLSARAPPAGFLRSA